MAGYSKRTARSIGAENLTKPDIAAAIEQGLNAQAEKAAITAERVINRIAEFAFDNENARDSDIIKACELLGKHFGLFSDKLELRAGSDNVQLILLPDNGFGADSPSRATRGLSS